MGVPEGLAPSSSGCLTTLAATSHVRVCDAPFKQQKFLKES